MHKKSFYLTCFLMLSEFVCSQTGGENRIIDYLENITYPEFSGVVLMAEKDSIFYEKAYGFKSLEYDVENNVNTLFNVASITKTMTAAAVLQLVDKGLLNLDVPVGRYLPNNTFKRRH